MSYGMPAQPPTSAAPVCPRHPDRVSYVRCQRCGRPACPECQRSAAVGVQCIDCVRETARSMPVQRTVYGGVAAPGKPVVTMTLMALCAGAFLLQWLVPGFTERFWYAPLYTLPNPIYDAEPWRMITSAFLHSQGFILHIAFNLYALWILGNHLEPLLGRLRFLALYLLSAFGGSVAVLLLSAPNVPVLGASGAVFGLFGALFIVQRQRGGDVKSLLVLIGINVVLGFVVSGISWQAHLGGLAVGALAALALAYAPRGKNRTALQVGGLLLLFLLLAGVTALKSMA
nr:rhomboid family intramembrane serine protease [Arthrobacter crystallopoietes]